MCVCERERERERARERERMRAYLHGLILTNVRFSFSSSMTRASGVNSFLASAAAWLNSFLLLRTPFFLPRIVPAGAQVYK